MTRSAPIKMRLWSLGLQYRTKVLPEEQMLLMRALTEYPKAGWAVSTRVPDAVSHSLR